MNHPLRTTAAVGGTVLALTGALLAGGTVAADAAEPTPSASSSASAPATTGHDAAAVRADVRAVMHALPGSLRKDLRAAGHHPTKQERHTALVAVEQEAAAGGYGTTAKTIAVDVRADWSSLPQRTQHRAEALVSGRRGDHVREFRALLRRALAGKDGTTLQHQLETLASSLPAVPAPTAAPGSSSGS